MKKRKILVMRFSSLGDVALVHPILKKLDKSNFEVHLLTLKEYSSLFKYNPYITKIIEFSKKESLLKLVGIIKKEKYYKILDLQKNLRALIIKFFFYFKTISYKKYKLQRFLLVHFKLNLLKKNLVLKNYFETLSKINIGYSERDFKFYIFYNIETKENVSKFFKKKKQYIAIAPMAKWKTKIWWGYDRLVDRLSRKYNIILLGNSDERKSIDKIKGERKNVINTAGKINLLEIVAIISKSSLLITNDSGIMHLGSGTETPIIAIFGSTVKEFGFVPIRKKVFIIEDNSVKCRPCDYHGKASCPKSHFKCMKNISLEMVLQQVERILK